MKFLKEEKYESRSHLQRATLSISLNITEGRGRYAREDFAQLLGNLLRSLNETREILSALIIFFRRQDK